MCHWPGPRSLATTNGVSVDVLSSRYLDVSVPWVRLKPPMNSEVSYLHLITGNPKPHRLGLTHLYLLNRAVRTPRHKALEFQLSKVGFPIRKSVDQSFFAAPHGLSQRSTSFIASQRQGIHQIPLRHLIALIAKARVFLPVNRQSTGTSLFGIEKTSFASNASGDLSGQAPNPRLVARRVE